MNTYKCWDFFQKEILFEQKKLKLLFFCLLSGRRRVGNSVIISGLPAGEQEVYPSPPHLLPWLLADLCIASVCKPVQAPLPICNGSMVWLFLWVVLSCMDVIADLTGRPVQASLPICNCALVWLRQFWSAVLFRRFWSDILEKIPKYSRIPVRCGEEISWNLRKLITAQLAVVCISQMCRHYCTKVSTLLHKVLPNGRPAQNYRIMKNIARIANAVTITLYSKAYCCSQLSEM